VSPFCGGPDPERSKAAGGGERLEEDPFSDARGRADQLGPVDDVDAPVVPVDQAPGARTIVERELSGHCHGLPRGRYAREGDLGMPRIGDGATGDAPTWRAGVIEREGTEWS
jgi:hypothetical protein